MIMKVRPKPKSHPREPEEAIVCSCGIIVGGATATALATDPQGNTFRVVSGCDCAHGRWLADYLRAAS